MLVNEEVIKKVARASDSPRLERGIRYYKNERIHIHHVSYSDNLNFSISASAEGSNGNEYDVNFDVVDGQIKNENCTCKDFRDNEVICKHIIGTLYAFANSKAYEKMFVFNNEKKIPKIEKKEEKPFTMEDLRNDPKRWSTYRFINAFVPQNNIINSIVLNSENNNIPKITDTKEGSISLEPHLKIDRTESKFLLSFKIGSNRMYSLKNLQEFTTNIENQKVYKYGNNLCFKHEKNMFDEESKKLIDYIIKYQNIMKYVRNSMTSYVSDYYKLSEMVIDDTNFDDFFEIFKNSQIEIDWSIGYYDDHNYRDLDNGMYEFIDGNDADDFKISFTLSKNDDDLEENQDGKEKYMLENDIIDSYCVIRTEKYIYLFNCYCIYRFDKRKVSTLIDTLETIDSSLYRKIIIDKEVLPMFFTYVYPKIKDNIEIKDISEEDKKIYIPKSLNTKIYLDYDKNDNIIANVKFNYDTEDFNPLSKNISQTMVRNYPAENEVLQMIKYSGFNVDENAQQFIMSDEDQIYNFLENDINNYTQKYEVMVSENFKSKQIHQPKIGSLGVKVENNLLQVDLKNIDFDMSEIKSILSKYKLKKKYHRLKDGSFLNLDSNDDIAFLDDLTDGMDIDYKQLSTGKIRVPVYRSVYLEKLLDNFKNTEIDKNEEYKEIINKTIDKEDDENIKPPKKFDKVLRTYQKTGFKWLKVLDDYKFGGILADDMGLGKTLQVITLITAYIEDTNNDQKNEKTDNKTDKINKKKTAKTSLVVCPSSLVLNWQNEFEKFSPKIKTLAIAGKASERKEKIKSLDNYDVIITSYDLLKRDIDYYTELDYPFKYVIADEAQYIKNSNTQNATALKTINAQTRYALTGTPIENSLSELWSIFDYILPGYLFSYNKFKKNYEMPIVKQENNEMLKKLKMLIEPFILRRVKKEVLTELPDKTISILDNEMTDEQQKIYLSYLAQAKLEAKEEIENNGFEKSHIKILALLTRLRQICCHPGMFLQNYTGGSSKLNQCIELVKDAIDSGHKILLFSQFTSMFDIIEKELKLEGIKYYKLIGSTKVDDRIKLVDDFNKNDNIKLFLISLKAGGTGLNLTGADVVIHYDPWWNISAENQATDRTYRIGQKNNVQVYKLITKNSIEEKINELQNKKAKLIDNMLDTNQTFISKLSKEDIMALFD